MNDSELVSRIRNGDREAFNQLYEKYNRQLFRMAYLYLGSREDAEDVLQETFVSCWLHIGTLKNPSAVKYWLYKIMHRLAIRRGKMSRREKPDENICEIAEQNTENRQTEEDAVISRVLFETIMDTLSPTLRETAALYYCDGLTTREIARITGTLEGTVKSRLHRVRKQLASSDYCKAALRPQDIRKEEITCTNWIKKSEA
ncbi:MAG: RNA polymerase sigma factor [Bilifractor sp.]|jgi:RNA polymerase sigma factor (sigma-70 family)